MAEKGRNNKRNLMEQKKSLNNSFHSAMSTDKQSTLKAVTSEMKRQKAKIANLEKREQLASESL